MTFSEPEVTVGRVPGNDVVLPKGNVSKRHSRIVLKENRFIVVDLKSTNGTYVNGRKITSPLVVKEGDKIYVGDYVLTLESAQALDAMRPPSLLSPEGGSKPLLTPVAPPLPPRTLEGALADDADADADVPVVLRGGSLNTSLPPGKLAAAEPDEPGEEAGGDDDDEPILPAEGELEEFERPSRELEGAASGDAFAVGHAEPLPANMPPVPVKRPARTLEMTSSNEFLGPLGFVLSDPKVFHVVVERFDRILADRGEGLVLEPAVFDSPDALVKTAWDLAALTGVPSAAVSYDVAIGNGLQVAAVLPAGGSNGPVMSLRRRPPEVRTLAALKERELITEALATKLEEALRKGRPVWLVGASSNELADLASGAIASCTADERIAILERAPEIALGERSAICLKLGALPVHELLERVRAFRPDRLVLQGVLEAELSAILPALAQHTGGSLAVLEARSAEAALASFERAVTADVTVRAASLVVELACDESGHTRASCYEVERDRAGVLKLKSV